MPLTPFHIGHALPIGLMDTKKNHTDLVALLFGSMLVDVHGILIFFFNFPGELHGIFHSFFLISVLGLIFAFILHKTDKIWQVILKKIYWEQKTTFFTKYICVISMAYIHIILDAGLYQEMNPFWPFIKGNPFSQWISSGTAYLLCTLGIFVGICQFIIIYIKSEKKEQ